jgi:hypothetical protein
MAEVVWAVIKLLLTETSVVSPLERVMTCFGLVNDWNRRSVRVRAGSDGTDALYKCA